MTHLIVTAICNPLRSHIMRETLGDSLLGSPSQMLIMSTDTKTRMRMAAIRLFANTRAKMKMTNVGTVIRAKGGATSNANATTFSSTTKEYRPAVIRTIRTAFSFD